jgi:pentalenene oxygenase
MRNDPLGFFDSLRSQGDIVMIQLGPQRAYVVTSAELVREILVTRSREFDKGAAMEEARAMFGDGLATSEGETHRRHRLLMQPAFRRDRLAQYAELMTNEITSLVDTWQDGQQLDVRKEMSALTLAVTCRAMMSSSAADDLIDEMQHGLPFILEVMYKRMVNPLAKLTRNLPTARNREFVSRLSRLHVLADKVVADYRLSGESENNDLLTMLLLAAEAGTGDSFSDQDVHDQIMTLLVAGTETTASTLSWIFHAISEHPAVEKRVHAEVDNVLAGRTVDYGSLSKLTYTAQVVKEALRYYPPAWMITRRAKIDTSLGGHQIAAGASVMFSPHIVNRDPGLYENPAEFDPDRWSPERVKDIPQEAVLNFGAGPRKCIGDAFAVMEASLTLASIASQWRLRPAGGQVTRLAGMALWPQNLHTTLQRR